MSTFHQHTSGIVAAQLIRAQLKHTPPCASPEPSDQRLLTTARRAQQLHVFRHKDALHLARKPLLPSPSRMTHSTPTLLRRPTATFQGERLKRLLAALRGLL